MKFSPLIEQLIFGLRILPGVGPKTAQRMAFQLLERDREKGKQLAKTLLQAMEAVGRCESCRTFSETPKCMLCHGAKRDASLLCIVESPIDLAAIEQTNTYKGLYFVLMGHLSPLDGIGPEEIGMKALVNKLSHDPIKEVILATNPTVEGEATAHYITGLINPYGIRISRIAHGVPLGGELEYIDASTLAHAFIAREIVKEKV